MNDVVSVLYEAKQEHELRTQAFAGLVDKVNALTSKGGELTKLGVTKTPNRSYIELEFLKRRIRVVLDSQPLKEYGEIKLQVVKTDDDGKVSVVTLETLLIDRNGNYYNAQGQPAINFEREQKIDGKISLNSAYELVTHMLIKGLAN